ncbi:lysylphosphatidylglycerol synthase transmembrane domain-containing protein [Methanolobus halotolerans]|uniref:TIGR00374 family protein n=1 Tax=Methanolobus halotolerans TaxID=2052935 RepID=A0A4E0PT91_9EURY|nr:flippase-like domain-containing protein [Methanolobus halotolerans]TGC07872.1 TIGR00374 family protein [Methanolobus halotolerans]
MNKVKKWLMISLLISSVSGFIVVLLTFDAETFDALLSIRPEFILAGICLHGLSYVMWGIRIRALCKTLGHSIGLRRAVEIVASSTFAASITPSSLGGEPVRIHLLHIDKIPLGKASAVVIGERVLDGIFILSLAPFSIYIFSKILDDPAFDVLLVLAELFLLGILFLSLYAIWRPGPTKKVTYFIVRKIAPILGTKTDAKLEKVMDKVDSELEHFHDSIAFFVKEDRKGLMIGIMYTLLFWLVEFSLLYVILLGLNQYPDPLVIFASQVLVMLLLAIPATPGASGVAEFGATTIFSVFVSSSLLGITVIAWRALTFYMNLVVGSFVSFRILKDTDFMKKFLK